MALLLSTLRRPLPLNVPAVEKLTVEPTLRVTVPLTVSVPPLPSVQGWSPWRERLLPRVVVPEVCVPAEIPRAPRVSVFAPEIV